MHVLRYKFILSPALEVSSEEHNEQILSLIERNKNRYCGTSTHLNEDATNAINENSK